MHRFVGRCSRGGNALKGPPSPVKQRLTSSRPLFPPASSLFLPSFLWNINIGSIVCVCLSLSLWRCDASTAVARRSGSFLRISRVGEKGPPIPCYKTEVAKVRHAFTYTCVALTFTLHCCCCLGVA